VSQVKKEQDSAEQIGNRAKGGRNNKLLVSGQTVCGRRGSLKWTEGGGEASKENGRCSEEGVLRRKEYEPNEKRLEEEIPRRIAKGLGKSNRK